MAWRHRLPTMGHHSFLCCILTVHSRTLLALPQPCGFQISTLRLSFFSGLLPFTLFAPPRLGAGRWLLLARCCGCGSSPQARCCSYIVLLNSYPLTQLPPHAHSHALFHTFVHTHPLVRMLAGLVGRGRPGSRGVAEPPRARCRPHCGTMMRGAAGGVSPQRPRSAPPYSGTCDHAPARPAVHSRSHP